METYNRGSVFYILTEVKKYAPFGQATLFDPSKIFITIVNSYGDKVIENAELTKESIGRYFYICQTTEDWETGMYRTKITTEYGSLTDITIDESGFYLI